MNVNVFYGVLRRLLEENRCEARSHRCLVSGGVIVQSAAALALVREAESQQIEQLLARSHEFEEWINRHAEETRVWRLRREWPHGARHDAESFIQTFEVGDPLAARLRAGGQVLGTLRNWLAVTSGLEPLSHSF